MGFLGFLSLGLGFRTYGLRDKHHEAHDVILNSGFNMVRVTKRAGVKGTSTAGSKRNRVIEDYRGLYKVI